MVTRGRQGCTFSTQRASGQVAAFPVNPVDTTGAGDGFVAGLLRGLYGNTQAWENQAVLAEICRYANAVGALTTTQRGAIPALPTRAEVEAFLGAAEQLSR